MLAMDSLPRTKHRPNKAKIDISQPLTALDSTLKLKLEMFRKELHSEYWGDMEDTLIGPHLFLTNAQILTLCHLTRAAALCNIEDLSNNFKWNCMTRHGEASLRLIYSV